MKSNCLKYYKVEKNKLKELLLLSNPRVSLMMDTWTSKQDLPFTASGENLSYIIISCLLEWNIEKIGTLTMDNASANDMVTRCLQDHYSSRRMLFENDHEKFELVNDASITYVDYKSIPTSNYGKPASIYENYSSMASLEENEKTSFMMQMKSLSLPIQSSEKNRFSIAQISLRILATTLTLASIFVMITSKQSVTVFEIVLEAKYSSTSVSE
ncbi:Casparian strip membrane protein domain [Dillenia turbinata]|uniref:CASP-like protein n=1 Tax=Dillenia turbinata TaxID=194707 RepID=A0AAN8YYM9_9MAGN